MGPMGSAYAALDTLERMDLKELRRVYRSTFKIKCLEPWRATIVDLILRRGARLPRMTQNGVEK